MHYTHWSPEWKPAFTETMAGPKWPRELMEFLLLIFLPHALGGFEIQTFLSLTSWLQRKVGRIILMLCVHSLHLQGFNTLIQFRNLWPKVNYRPDGGQWMNTEVKLDLHHEWFLSILHKTYCHNRVTRKRSFPASLSQRK